MLSDYEISLILLLASASLHGLILAFLALGWLRGRRDVPRGPASPLSVVIAARNEVRNLQLYLPVILEQDHDNFEVIVVLDRCTDSSASMIAGLSEKYPNLRMLEIREVPEGWTPKKWAIRSGVEAARNERIVLTDADCRPGQGWLLDMDGQFRAGAELVLGTSPYFRRPGLLNWVIRSETFFTAVQYIGAAGWNKPYMAVGRNLGYTRSFFRAAGALEDVKSSLSGDDDLLVNHSERPQTGWITTRVHSVPEKTWTDWWRQKTRHVSAGNSYTWASKLFLSSFHGLHAIFYLSLILVSFHHVLIALLIYLLRTIWVMAWLLIPARKWKSWDVWAAFPGFDCINLLYNLLLVPVGLLRKPKW